MIRTEIIVEGNKLDTSAELEALLTFSIDDIREFAARNTKYSKTIVVPGSNQNNFIFGNIFDINIYNSHDAALDNVGYNYNAAKSAACLVFVDRVQVFKGVIRILEIIITDGMVEYECAIFGELGGFIGQLGDGLLGDLDFSDYDHVYNETNIIASWSTTPGTGYHYPVIDYGYTTNGVDYDVKNFRPALHVKEYLDKIFFAAGYTYESPFMETALFKRLILPATVNTLQIEVPQLFNKTVTTLVTEEYPYNIPWQNNVGAQYTTGMTILGYNRNGNINVTLNVSFEILVNAPNTDPVTTTVQVRKNGVAIKTYTYNSNVAGETAFNEEDTIITSLKQTDTLAIYINSNVNKALGGYVYTQVATFSAVGNPTVKFEIQLGDTLPMNSAVPESIKQIDLFKAIVNMFNLYVTEDEERRNHLIISPYVTYYDSDLSNALDWTRKVDYSKPIKIKPLGELNHKAYVFKYKDDADYYNDQYKKKFDQTYGTRIIDTNLDFVQATKTLELPFASLVLTQYAGDNKVVGCMFKQTNGVKEQYNAVVRIAYRSAGPLSANPWNIKNGTTTLSTPTTYGYAGHVDDPIAPTVDLLWGAPQELYYTADVYPVGNLFNVYWDLYLGEIIDKDSKLLTAFVRLTAVDIMTLDFSKFIFIGGQLFRLNKVEDFNTLAPEVTKCELINVINIA